jgi:ABC-type Fe3+-hydroxamate transport system substrate-binding protein
VAPLPRLTVVVRVVSLVPSMTETLLAWGITPLGVTRFCEQPAITAVGGTKDPDVPAIVALRPDLVVVDAEENRKEDHEALVGRGVEVWVLRIRSLDDVAAQLAPLAESLGVRWAPAPLGSPAPSRCSAFVPVWRNPWIALGGPTYGTSLLEHLGVVNVFVSDGPYPGTTLDEATRRGPDRVIAPSEPYPFGERHRAELERVAPTVLVDGKDLVWWGVRTSAAIARLDAALG